MNSAGWQVAFDGIALRLLILTSCRLGEIMTLQWEHVDIPGKALRLPDSKTGAKVCTWVSLRSKCWRRSNASTGRPDGPDRLYFITSLIIAARRNPARANC